MRRWSWLLAALVAGTLTACGGDDEGSTSETRKPPLTVPGESTGTTSDATESTEGTDTAPEDDGGGGSGSGSGGGPDEPTDQPNPGNGGVPAPDSNNPPAEDSPGNDTPPAPGSPEERFERFCEENPGAC